MKQNPQFIVYFIGIFSLGLFHGPMKSALGGQWLFLLAGVSYLLALRVLGAWVARCTGKGRLSRDA
jgi:hypothetical protein